MIQNSKQKSFKKEIRQSERSLNFILRRISVTLLRAVLIKELEVKFKIVGGFVYERNNKGRQLIGHRKLRKGHFFFCCSWCKEGRQFSLFIQPRERNYWKLKPQQSEQITCPVVPTGDRIRTKMQKLESENVLSYMGKISMNLELESTCLMNRCKFSIYSKVNIKFKVQKEVSMFQTEYIPFSASILFKGYFSRNNYVDL